MKEKTDPPFIFGTQYYRAPTPHPECWESDLHHMREAGFNSVKFWVQWRWVHREENTFYFADLDRLMDIAESNGLRVTLNVICDVAPVWLYEKYPDAKMVTADGQTVEPQSTCFRQIGGFPGPCYNHPGALLERVRFMEETVRHFADHPALDMWDVWNEPEQCGVYRAPEDAKLVCFCPHCRKKFTGYLAGKYREIARLNAVWGKCYGDFADVELPLNGSTFGDFMDFREFRLDTMTAEANWRLETVRRYDTRHAAYLHVVPNTSSVFNGLTGVDDFALAERCDVFASTNFATPIWSVLTTSAAQGKVCYNVECHIGNGSIRMHQKQITYADLVRDLVPQIGAGIRGFMFWQYRPETLGAESPAWGATLPDGRPGSVLNAARRFARQIAPITEELMRSPKRMPSIAIWKGRKNELFQYCVHGELEGFAAAIESYVNALYYNNYDCRIVDDEAVIRGLDGTKLLILPRCYALTGEMAAAVVRAAQAGVTVLCEAHLGGYDVNTGRHSLRMPGCGLAERLGIVETYTTSSYHLKNGGEDGGMNTDGLADDVKKAIASYGLSGGKYYPILLTDGTVLSGALRFAALSGEDAAVLGTFNGESCILSKRVGRGRFIYCGTDLGDGAQHDAAAFEAFLRTVCRKAGVADNGFHVPRGVHIDRISDTLIAVNNTTETPVTVHCGCGVRGVLYGGYSETGTWTVPGATAEILAVSGCAANA